MKIKESPSFKIGGPRATYVLVICCLLYAIQYADWQVMSVVLEPMKLALGLSDGQAGLVGSVYFIGIILCSLPAAHLVDRWSRSKTIGVMAFVWSAFTLVTGTAAGLNALIISRFGVGAGAAGFPPGATALVSASYPEEKRAKVLGIFNSFITIGIIFGVIVGGYLSAHHGGWRTPFYIFAIPGIVLRILAFFMQDYRLQKEDGSDFVHDSLGRNLKTLAQIPTLRWLYVGLGMYAVLQISVGTWFPALLMRAYPIKEDVAGLVMGVVTIFGIAGPLLGGVLADRWQRKRPGGRMRLAVEYCGRLDLRAADPARGGRYHQQTADDLLRGHDAAAQHFGGHGVSRRRRNNAGRRPAEAPRLVVGRRPGGAVCARRSVGAPAGRRYLGWFGRRLPRAGAGIGDRGPVRVRRELVVVHERAPRRAGYVAC
jgi:MFS family permease